MKILTEKQVKHCLETISERRKIMENAVQSLCTGFTPALFVWGPPGLGKSHTLCVMLDGMAQGGWRHHTAHSTPKALMMSLAEDPNAIHMFEDCERMLKIDLASSLLRAACGAPNERDRWVTYETANERLRVKFTGAIIVVTNANLAKTTGPLQGVASRFRPVKWDMTLEERIAVILDLAKRGTTKGGVSLSPKECRTVAVTLVEMVGEQRAEFELDIRLYTEHALPAYAQAKVNPGMDWQSLMLAKLTGTAQTTDETQEVRTRRLRQLAQLIDAQGGKASEKVQRWKNQTGLGQAIYYRHLREAKRPLG